MSKMSRRSTVAILAIVLMTMLAWSSGTSARMEFGNLEISGEIFILAEAQWNSDDSTTSNFALNPGVPGLFLGPGDFGVVPSNGTPNNNRWEGPLTAFRTELLIEAVYKGIPHVSLLSFRGLHIESR